jgi:hypothetical protein
MKYKAELYQTAIIVKKKIHQEFQFTVILEQKYYFFLSACLCMFVPNQVIKVFQPLFFFPTLLYTKYFLLPPAPLCPVIRNTVIYHTTQSYHTTGAARIKHGIVIFTFCT